jgi:hypothetical protein
LFHFVHQVKSVFPSRSNLLMNNNWFFRILQTATNLCLFLDTFATSITTITLSTAVKVLKYPLQNLYVPVYREYLFFCLYNWMLKPKETEIPLWRSISIKSLVAPFNFIILYSTCFLNCTTKRRSFSVSVVFPASGCEIIPKVLLRCISKKAHICINSLQSTIYICQLKKLYPTEWDGFEVAIHRIIQY